MLKQLLPLALFAMIISVQAVTPPSNAKLRDPTVPFGTTSTRALENNFQIDGIFIGPNNRIVLINGQRFSVGDVIMGAKIIAINTREIRLQDDTGEYTVLMSNVSVKHPTTSKVERNP
ncbi:MAG: hypothetical protein M1561_02480 [Gammaproteobacteria bacterium]|nr:hypothetical protein [Gammaproteobacteria bacterium]